jgi:hypothetical protein
MKRFHLLLLLGLLASHCQLPEPKANSAGQPSSTQPSPEKVTAPKSKWEYGEDADKMSNQKRYFAFTTSTNKIEFEFPYNGGSSFQLVVRNMGQGNEVMLSVSKGQFMTSIMDSESLRLKFDEEAPFNVNYNSSADASTDAIFLRSSSKIISKLKSAKKLMIEAPFFNAGRQIIYFDVEGLNWTH